MKVTLAAIIQSGGRRGERGFTIVEIIMAFIIIGILTAVLVPTFSNRSRDAKKAATISDLNALADAQERAAVDTGFYYRMNVLDDTRGGDFNLANARDPQAAPPPANQLNIDGILDNGITTDNYYDQPDVITISTTTGDYPASAAAIFRERILPNETRFNWNGPYLNWHLDANNNDWPDDPYGNDYLFFTRVGVLYPPDRNVRPSDEDVSYQFQVDGPETTVSDGTGGTTTRRFRAGLIFDRPTILSMGPNGLPGDGTSDPNDGYGKGDDVFRSFGGI